MEVNWPFKDKKTNGLLIFVKSSKVSDIRRFKYMCGANIYDIIYIHFHMKVLLKQLLRSILRKSYEN